MIDVIADLAMAAERGAIGEGRVVAETQSWAIWA